MLTVPRFEVRRASPVLLLAPVIVAEVLAVLPAAALLVAALGGDAIDLRVGAFVRHMH